MAEKIITWQPILMFAAEEGRKYMWLMRYNGYGCKSSILLWIHGFRIKKVYKMEDYRNGYEYLFNCKGEIVC